MTSMRQSFFSEETLDDVIRAVMQELETNGEVINPTKGSALELRGILIEIRNPLARLSRTETRGKIFSCLGELCWYLARVNDADFISYYIPQYKKYEENGRIFGGYGPRLFDWHGINQVKNVIALLSRKEDTRQAVIQLFDAADVIGDHKDVPCTCSLQFLARNNRLDLIAYMRSNDAYLGLPHDVFCFTMLQEIVARSLSVQLGTYKHAVGSFHLYDGDTEEVRRLLNEGYQSTEPIMPPMPDGDPWPGVEVLLEAEASLRSGQRLNNAVDDVDDYWGDLIRLLGVYRCWKERDAECIAQLRDRMGSNVYNLFIDPRLESLS
jgi:thymidylate synthase